MVKIVNKHELAKFRFGDPPLEFSAIKGFSPFISIIAANPLTFAIIVGIPEDYAIAEYSNCRGSSIDTTTKILNDLCRYSISAGTIT